LADEDKVPTLCKINVEKKDYSSIKLDKKRPVLKEEYNVR
jgi:hypothetical protein